MGFPFTFLNFLGSAKWSFAGSIDCKCNEMIISQQTVINNTFGQTKDAENLGPKEAYKQQVANVS